MQDKILNIKIDDGEFKQGEVLAAWKNYAVILSCIVSFKLIVSHDCLKR
jgi:hypothetical protein